MFPERRKSQSRPSYSKHDQIGEVRIPLSSIDLAQTIEEWRNLTKVETDNDQVSGLIKLTAGRLRRVVSPSQSPPFCRQLTQRRRLVRLRCALADLPSRA